MAIAKKSCRICGKVYKACRNENQLPDVFHWRDVACSLECGTVYLQQIEESRRLVQKVAQNIKDDQDSGVEQVVGLSTVDDAKTIMVEADGDLMET